MRSCRVQVREQWRLPTPDYSVYRERGHHHDHLLTGKHSESQSRCSMGLCHRVAHIQRTWCEMRKSSLRAFMGGLRVSGVIPILEPLSSYLPKTEASDQHTLQNNLFPSNKVLSEDNTPYSFLRNVISPCFFPSLSHLANMYPMLITCYAPGQANPRSGFIILLNRAPGGSEDQVHWHA